MHRRSKNSPLLTNTMITELPEVRAHLAYLEAQYQQRLARATAHQRTLQPAPGNNPLTITIPLSTEIINAVKAVETDGMPSAHKQHKPERRRRRKAANRVDEAAA